MTIGEEGDQTFWRASTFLQPPLGPEPAQMVPPPRPALLNFRSHGTGVGRIFVDFEELHFAFQSGSFPGGLGQRAILFKFGIAITGCPGYKSRESSSAKMKMKISGLVGSKANAFSLPGAEHFLTLLKKKANGNRGP